MIDFSAYPNAKIFSTHGVDFTGQQGDQLYGYCPFTERENKFYVSTKTWLWDSKTGGMSGNIPQFLDAIQKDYEGDLEPEHLESLSRHRGLPVAAFKPWHFGRMEDRYTIPVRDYNGRMQDIRMYHMVSRQMRSTTGCKTGLLGAHLLARNPAAPVYICEGEWDAIALAWLLRELKDPGLVVAAPGAGTFKNEWVPWLTGRRVFVLYDNDEAGRKGEHTVQQRLGSAVKQMTFTHWPDSLPDGFDVRDWIKYGIKKGTLDLCLERLRLLFKKSPRQTGASSIFRTKLGIRISLQAPVHTEKIARPAKVPTLADVHQVYEKWLHLPNTNAIDVMLATALSQQMDGPPVWMFLVGPPGGAKTVTLTGLSEYDRAYNTSSLTAHSLISGSNMQGQGDPSLIPRLRDKILVIKDFTSILGMRDNDKEEIFGILRDAYDGRCGKVFGNGVERSYESRFTIIAAVTPAIYDLGPRHSALGERFLKYVMGDNLHHEQEEDIISRAIDNVDQDSRIREELSSVTGTFLTYGFENLRPAKLDNLIHRRIIALAQLGARLRGTVSREVYNTDMMTGRPFAEVGSRLGIQLAKIARALAMVRGKSEVTMEEYIIVKKIMIDTVSQRSEDIVRTMFTHQQESGDPFLTPAKLQEITRYPATTVRRMLDDLNLLKVVARRGLVGQGFKHVWALSPYILRCISESQVYLDPAPVRMALRRRPIL